MKYMFILPCKKCLLDIMCKKGCRDLANFTYNYHLYINYADEIIEPKLKKVFPRKIFGVRLGEFLMLGIVFPAAAILAFTVPGFLREREKSRYNDRIEDVEKRYLQGDDYGNK